MSILKGIYMFIHLTLNYSEFYGINYWAAFNVICFSMKTKSTWARRRRTGQSRGGEGNYESTSLSQHASKSAIRRYRLARKALARRLIYWSFFCW